MRNSEIGPLYKLENIHPGFSIDCVIFSFHKGKMKILLNKLNTTGNFWTLPGGFMFTDEDSDSAAHRILQNRTGLNNIFLKQFYLFSNPARTIREQNKELIEQNVVDKDAAEWFLQRYVSLGYYAFVNYDEVEHNKVVVKSEETKWVSLGELPRMYSDHADIIHTAFEMVPALLPLASIARQVLPEKFTITEIRTIYETFLNKECDRRNFQRKILSEDLIIQLEERKESKAFNPPFLYVFNHEKIEMLEGSVNKLNVF